MSDSVRRLGAAPGVIVPVAVLVATVLHALGEPLVGVALVLWLVLALGIGFALPRWWTFLLAAIPWPIGVGLALAIGRYAFLGDFWPLAALLSVLTGVCGIGYGWLVRRGWELRRRKRQRPG